MTNDEFIKKSQEKHKNEDGSPKYDYSKVEYVDQKTYVTIICPKHEEFKQAPNIHLYGKGCPFCESENSSSYKKITQEEFIEQAQKIHKNEDDSPKFDYSKVNYVNKTTKVCIICPKHGEFWQTPYNHLHSQGGCIGCAKELNISKRSSNTEKFIKKAKEIHKDENGNPKYDYSKVNYINSNTKICIICPKHGEFWQTPANHLTGNSCPKCSNEIIGNLSRSSTEAFIKKAKEIHKDENGNPKYDYSKVEYKNARTKVCIICKEHGEFWQIPDKHISGQGCPICSNLKRSKKRIVSKQGFIRKANLIHNNKYEYVKYEKVSDYVTIICPIHGEFQQIGTSHLKGKGCPKCAIEIRKEQSKLTKEEFIERCIKVHGFKYDYSNAHYVNMDTPICIICPKHGEFYQTPSCHLSGHGCHKCNGGVKSNTEEFIKKAKNIHHNSYDYSNVNYKNNTKKVEIKCNKCGNIFYQSPSKHLSGCGCPICKFSHLEENIYNLLKEQNIHFISQCNSKTLKWLKKLSLDFYLPDYNIAIECQGIQHFKPLKIFGGEEGFKSQIKRDELKKKLSEENGIKLLYFAKSKYGRDDIITSEDELIEIIKKTPLNNSNSI